MNDAHAGGSREVVHDIRNRLTVARANLEAFLDGKLKPSKSRLETILQALAQADALLDDLRGNSGRAARDVRLEPIDVCALLDREYAVIEPLAAKKGIALTVSRCPVKVGACAHFIADPVRVSEIVSNVLLNAIRYTPPGGSMLVDCSRHAGQLQIVIADSGPGITESDAQHVFERGYRGYAAAGTAGSGFGLAIAKELAEAHGGSIELFASGAQGAQFTVRLPGTVVADPKETLGCAHCGLRPSAAGSREKSQ